MSNVSAFCCSSMKNIIFNARNMNNIMLVYNIEWRRVIW
jgi:hypothetical protein